MTAPQYGSPPNADWTACPVCHTSQLSSQQFCGSCGAPLIAPATTSASVTSGSGSSARSIAIVAAGLALVLIVLVAMGRMDSYGAGKVFGSKIIPLAIGTIGVRRMRAGRTGAGVGLLLLAVVLLFVSMAA